jgi:hypothetical protein
MFSGSAFRFVDRRDLIVTEANSIGTAYLRLDLLPAETQPSLRQLFRDYTDARIRGFQLIPDAQAWEQFDQAKSLQKRIWHEAVAAGSRASSPPVLALVLEPINDMIDITSTHEAALYAHPPVIFYVLMVALAIVCSTLAGRSMASRRFGKNFYRITFAAMFAFTFMIMLDTEFPRAGFITVRGLDSALSQARDAMN